MKKVWKVIVIILVLAVIALSLLIFRLATMSNRMEADEAKISSMDLRRISDGIYTGNYGDFVVSAKVVVTVNGHRITGIKIIKQDCGPGYNALETINRIIKAQSPKVDVVTGASSSSRAIMVAVYRALKQGIK